MKTGYMLRAVALIFTLFILGYPCVRAGEEAGKTTGTQVLDTYSTWRCHVTLRPIPFGTQNDAKPHAKGTYAVGFGSRKPTVPLDGPVTPFPPDGWARPDFDDSRWWRDPGPFFGGGTGGGGHRSLPHNNKYGVEQASLLYLLCARGKFSVEDPGSVKSLNLSLAFRGGVRVFLNGREAGRSHLPEGDISFLTLADDYPLEASLEKGKLINCWKGNTKSKNAELRIRAVERLSLPIDRLVKGVNVLAIEIHRAAMPEEMTKVSSRGAVMTTTGMFWNTVGLIDVNLTAEGSGITPNIGRPKGLRVWNANVIESVYESDCPDACEPLRPMRIVGARNGSFGGQVLVGSTESIKGLRAEVSPLAHRNGKGEIPVSAMKVRYPKAVFKEFGSKFYHRPVGGRRDPVAVRFHDLLESPPAVVPAKNWPDNCAGAVQPVWLTVDVPDDAGPGDYTGKLTVSVEGMKPTEVTVALEVYDHRLPDPENLQLWVDFFESPENLAENYKVPLWSDTHWSLIEKSMRFLVDVKNKTLYMPIITRCNVGNTQSMVLWRKKGGGYEPDFGIIERYLDTALKVGVKPEVVCFQVWDYHVGLNYDRKFRIGTGMYGQPTKLEKGKDDPGILPPPISVIENEGGAVTEIKAPKYDADGKAFWKPVADGLKSVVEKRGLGGKMMLGLVPDFIPKKEIMAFWAELLPGVPWVTMGHGLPPRKEDGGRRLYDFTVGYSTTVFGVHFAMDPAVERQDGWKRQDQVAYFSRGNSEQQLAADRTLFEKGLTAGTRGAGRLDLDFFGFRTRFPESKWGSLTLGLPWLAPAEGGPISTTRFENAKEAIQECEARIYIERALDDDAKRAKLGAELAKRCREIADARTRAVIWAQEKNTNRAPHSSLPGGPLGLDWYAGSDWQSRSADLYRAAAEVAKSLK